MAQSRGVSLNKLFEQLTAQALTENDIELRYRRMAAIGSAERGLELLDQLDRSEREQWVSFSEALWISHFFRALWEPINERYR